MTRSWYLKIVDTIFLSILLVQQVERYVASWRMWWVICSVEQLSIRSCPCDSSSSDADHKVCSGWHMVQVAWMLSLQPSLQIIMKQMLDPPFTILTKNLIIWWLFWSATLNLCTLIGDKNINYLYQRLKVTWRCLCISRECIIVKYDINFNTNNNALDALQTAVDCKI